jgi:hypothetical protein
MLKSIILIVAAVMLGSIALSGLDAAGDQTTQKAVFFVQ